MSETDLRRLQSELERSRAARLRAWQVLQGFREILAAGGLQIEKPAEKSFAREGEILQRALKKALSGRDEALRDLAEAARWVDRLHFRTEATSARPTKRC
jgi:hypothetical protein